MRTHWLLVLLLGMSVFAACGGSSDSGTNAAATATRVVELAELATVQAAQAEATEAPATVTPTDAPEATATDVPTATATQLPTAIPRPTTFPITLADVFPSSTELPHGATLLKEEQISASSLLGSVPGFIEGQSRDYKFERMTAGNMEGLTITCAQYETDGFAFGAMDLISSQLTEHLPDGSLTPVDSETFGHLSVAAEGSFFHEGEEIPIAFIWVQQWKFMCQYIGLSWGTGPPTVNMKPIIRDATARLANWPPATPTPMPTGTYQVEYLLSSSARVHGSLTYSNQTGGTEQVSDYVLPWNKVYTMRHGDFAYVSVQNKSSYGSVTCQIKINGVVWKQSTSEGAYAIATCSGSVGQ